MQMLTKILISYIEEITYAIEHSTNNVFVETTLLENGLSVLTRISNLKKSALEFTNSNSF